MWPVYFQSRHNDREEIRRKLAMGTDEEYYGGERMFKKPNLQTRLQGGMNLQICFVNEASATENEASVTENGMQSTAEAEKKVETQGEQVSNLIYSETLLPPNDDPWNKTFAEHWQ